MISEKKSFRIIRKVNRTPEKYAGDGHLFGEQSRKFTKYSGTLAS